MAETIHTNFLVHYKKLRRWKKKRNFVLYSRYFIAQDAEEVRRVVMFCKVMILSSLLMWHFICRLINWCLLSFYFCHQWKTTISVQACHEHEKDVANIVKCKCAVLKEQDQEENFKCELVRENIQNLGQFVLKKRRRTKPIFFQLLEVPGCPKATVGEENLKLEMAMMLKCKRRYLCWLICW